MEETKKEAPQPEGVDVPALVRQTLEEFTRAQQAQSEPAYKVELQEERKRREQLERQVNALVEENKQSRRIAEEADRSAAIKGELQKLGVGKVDLAFKAVKDDIARGEDGRLIGRTESGEVGLRDYLSGFVNDNPEFLPARISGGSGVAGSQKASQAGGTPVDLDRIKPGMSADELEKARQEVARIASQTLRGA